MGTKYITVKVMPNTHEALRKGTFRTFRAKVGASLKNTLLEASIKFRGCERGFTVDLNGQPMSTPKDAPKIITANMHITMYPNLTE